MRLTAPRRLRSLLVCVSLLFPVASFPAVHSPEVPTGPPLSRISVTGQVKKATVEASLRERFSEAVPNEWQQTRRELDLKVLGSIGATIRYRTSADQLSFSADGKGNLGLKIPIAVDVQPDSSGLAKLGVRTEGCGRTNFALHISFVAHVVDDELTISRQKLWASSGDFACVIGPNLAGKVFTLGTAPEVDVAAQIRSAIKSEAGPLFADAQGRLNRVLVAGSRLAELARQPVVFGSGVRLGIVFHRLVPTRLYADSRWLKLDGVVEGRPWLDFGPDSGRSPVVSTAGDPGQGFHLPALLLFPTSPAPAPAEMAEAVATKRPQGFSLRPVPGRNDLVILQRTQNDTTEDVIWLSGGAPPAVPKTRYFEQPLTGVLDQILQWLNHPELWQGVAGVETLKSEVAAFRRLVEHFQEENRLPLGDNRGEMHFSQLSLDLVSVRVGPEAIWAEVVLRGQAGLEIDFSL